MSTTAKIKEQVLITGMIRFQYLWRIATHAGMMVHS